MVRTACAMVRESGARINALALRSDDLPGALRYWTPRRYELAVGRRGDKMVLGIKRRSTRRGQGAAASYSLTQRGLEKARARRRASPVGAVAKIRRFRECMAGDGAANALRALFRRPEYAEYAPNTRVAHRYRAITWGRGV